MSKRLTVTRTWVIKEGSGAKGPWALRGVEANDAEGNPVAVPLKTFANVPLGPVEVEVEVQDSEQYGRSYLLKPVGGARNAGGAASQQLLDELRGRIERLESRLDALDFAPAAGAARPQQSPGIPDDDIPF